MSTEIDPKKAQRAKAYFETGLDAAQKRNLDYALKMLADACHLMPTHLPYRQALRATQRLKYENDPAKVGMMAKTRAKALRAQIQISKSTGAWLKALEGCEDAFAHYPWDFGVTMDAAEAALELGAADLADWNLSTVADDAEESLDFLRLRARVYEAAGKWAPAIHCYEKIKHISPADQDISSKINAISAKAMMAKSGLESGARRSDLPIGEAIGRETPRETIRVIEHAEENPATPELKLSPEDRLKKELEATPGDVRAAFSLADLYKAAQKWDEADRVLTAVLKHAPDDIYLRQIHADTRLQRLERALAQWEKHIAANPGDADAPAKRAELVRKRDEFEIAEYQRRIALNPADAESQFKLGSALARADRLDEAIAAFQQARNNAEWKVKALSEAGQCFEKIGSAKLAERTYTDALKAVPADDTATFNNLHYRLGCLAERNGQLQSAEDHFNEVAANDYGYKDVAKRLRDIQSKM